jgi:peptidoglycan/xylan/chitin deacetylase (PgdA/CDA1 family)
MAADLLRGAYPRFVYGGGQQEVPVFTTHGVEPESFERQLRFLRDNGYRTLTADEFFDVASGARAPQPRSVVLTYDDGLGSLWSVGLPLLKRYGMKVVIFLIPARIRSGGLGPTLDDLRAGRADAATVLARDTSEKPLLTWEEIAAMHDTGLVDFQSHSLTHGMVFCSDRLSGFVSPSLARRLTRFQVPEWTPQDDGCARLGRPLYPAAPRLSDCRRYLEDLEARRACEAHVEQRGGAAFFERPGWRRELEEQWRTIHQRQPSGGRYETDAERETALGHELRESKRLIEARLPGKTVRHLAYPWGRDCELAMRLAAQAGYASVFPGKVAGSYVGITPGRPLIAARFGMDFLPRLPGRGREALWRTLAKKLSRNATAGANGTGHAR